MICYVTFVHQEVPSSPNWRVLKALRASHSITAEMEMSSAPILLWAPAPVLGSPLHPSAHVTFAAIRPCGAQGGSAFQLGLSPRELALLTTFVPLSPRHNTYLQECTGQREPTYQLNIHDIKLLFLRFAMEQSFSADTGGGGRESNIHLIPYIIHTVLYVLNTSVSHPPWAAAGPPACPPCAPLPSKVSAFSRLPELAADPMADLR